MSQPVRIVSVVGGPGHSSALAGSLEARVDDMQTTATLIGGVGADMAELALAAQRYLVDPDVLASAPLDPVGAARFEWAMAQALDGQAGLALMAIEVAVSGVKLHVAAVAYQTADELSASLMHLSQFAAALPEVAGQAAGHMLDGESPGTHSPMR